MKKWHIRFTVLLSLVLLAGCSQATMAFLPFTIYTATHPPSSGQWRQLQSAAVQSLSDVSNSVVQANPDGIAMSCPEPECLGQEVRYFFPVPRNSAYVRARHNGPGDFSVTIHRSGGREEVIFSSSGEYVSVVERLSTADVVLFSVYGDSPWVVEFSRMPPRPEWTPNASLGFLLNGDETVFRACVPQDFTCPLQEEIRSVTAFCAVGLNHEDCVGTFSYYGEEIFMAPQVEATAIYEGDGAFAVTLFRKDGSSDVIFSATDNYASDPVTLATTGVVSMTVQSAGAWTVELTRTE
ncbi:hypothetical protein GC175_19215 [bacterium]|nr:hypothetical protein [bacterium]